MGKCTENSIDTKFVSDSFVSDLYSYPNYQYFLFLLPQSTIGTMQHDHTHERALAHFEKLIALRPTFLHHKSVLVSVDHAIGNVFKPQNHDEIGNYIPKIEKLVGFVQEMNKLGVRTTGIGLRLPDLHVSQAKPKYQEVNAKYERLRDVRHQLTVLGIPTIDVEIAMADILMVILIYLSRFCTQLTNSLNRSMVQLLLSRF